MRESSTRLSLPLSRQPSYLHFLLSFPSHCQLGSSALTPLVYYLTSPFALKLQTDLTSFCSCFVEQSPIWSTSRCWSLHSFTYIKLTCVWSFSLSFLTKLKTHLFHNPFPPYSVFTQAIWDSRTDISSIDQASLIHLILISPSFILISFKSILFISLVSVYEEVVINLLNILCTSIAHCYSYSPHLIIISYFSCLWIVTNFNYHRLAYVSALVMAFRHVTALYKSSFLLLLLLLFSYLPSHFISMEQMLMSMLTRRLVKIISVI